MHLHLHAAQDAGVSTTDPEHGPTLEGAITAFLLACGLDLDHKDLQGTPQRVARLWQSSFLNGYAMDPAQILADTVEGEGQSELVVLRDLPCHGMCPHHLMPWTGKATIAYLPGCQLVGFGRLHELLRCFSQRLTLQERVCNDICDALMTFLDAKGAACSIQARHNCLNVPDDKHCASVLTSSLRGELRTRTDLQRLFVA